MNAWSRRGSFAGPSVSEERGGCIEIHLFPGRFLLFSHTLLHQCPGLLLIGSGWRIPEGVVEGHGGAQYAIAHSGPSELLDRRLKMPRIPEIVK
jgi:hypothetical protein